MYQIIKTDGKTAGFVEDLRYIKQHPSNGAYVEADELTAQGVAVNGTPYNLLGRAGLSRTLDTVHIVELADDEAAGVQLTVAQTAKLEALSAACNAAIVGGCDVALSGGVTGHISLTAEDQINLTNAYATIQAGAAGYPYHLDGTLCGVYSAADINTMAQAATAHKLYHTTYFNHLKEWVKRSETVEAVEAIVYGSDLPEDLAANMAAVLGAAS